MASQTQRLWDELIATYIREGQHLAAQQQPAAADDSFCMALDLLMRSYQQAVIGFCRHMLGRPAAAAEDLAQEVFLAAWRTMPGFRHAASIRTWVFAIARNHCRDALQRREAPQGHAAPSRRAPLDIPDPAPPPHAQQEHQDFLMWVQQGLAQLNSEDRAVLVLTYITELPPAEMAQVLGLAEASVRTRRRRALQHLREIVADEHQRARRVHRGGAGPH